MGQSISEADDSGRGRAAERMVYLIYHELEGAGGAPCTREEGYLRYIVRESEFRRQIAFLCEEGFRGVNVSTALDAPADRNVAITFDDGCESDLTVAAPLLREANFQATFFVVVGKVGTPGHLSLPQLLELQRLGFEIGCHSMSHPHLTDLSGVELRHEIVDAKGELEQMLGRRIDHFSCPGGRWNRRVAELTLGAGYLSVATSRIGLNSPASDPYSLARVGVMRSTTLVEFQAMCQGRGLWRPKMRALVLSSVKRVLGNSRYDRMRSGLLDGKSPAA